MTRSDISDCIAWVERHLASGPKTISLGCSGLIASPSFFPIGMVKNGRCKEAFKAAKWESENKFAEDQDRLRSSEKQCTLVCRLLERITPTKTLNKSVTSYTWKRWAELLLGWGQEWPKPMLGCDPYISNGQFICAALFMGFECEQERSLNAWLNIGRRDTKRLILEQREDPEAFLKNLLQAH